MQAGDPIDQIDRISEELSGHAVEDYIRQRLAELRPTTGQRAMEQVFLAGVSGVHWVGTLLTAGLALKAGGDQVEIDGLLRAWLDKHSVKLRLLEEALAALNARLEMLGDVTERVESDEYLSIVREAFRVWDEAETEEKRQYVGHLIGNAAGQNIVSDDVVRLFVEWVRTYHEIHFSVIRAIYKRPHSTRRQIWIQQPHSQGKIPREDSAEADLFRLVIRDLSTGGVIRQRREVDRNGNFVRQPATRRPRGTPAPATLESSFDDDDEYVLTALGDAFVRYTIEDLVPLLSEGN